MSTQNRPRHLNGINGKLSRRQILKLSAAAGITGVLAPLGVRAEQEEVVRRSIPSSGQQIPVIGLGTARTFNVITDDSPALAPLKQVLEAFYQGGGRLIDSSPMYGSAESVVGRLANDLGIASDLFMATKVWTRGETEGIAQIKQSEKRMGKGSLDLVQVHNLVDTQTQLDTLKAWKKEGRIRYIGVTHYRSDAHDELAKLCEKEPLDFVQFNYNIATRDAEQRLLPAARDNGVATLINEPFESGSLFGKVRGESLPEWAADWGIKSWAQFFLKFIVSHPAVTCAIPATSDPEHARDNIRAALSPLPDQTAREKMAALFNRL
ncbi:aldo/keto reductase [Marinobacter sp. V034]|uniref:aldo/keto reductase n=1 Tax=Marinobacter sp. V034 TaxID=3459610 RepID=UPI0040445D30